jgi:hypothetical protein
MKTRLKKTVLGGIAISIVAFLVLFALSTSFRASVYRAIPYGGSYSTFDRLADMLRLGMNTNEVCRILGTPQTQEDLGHGQRWRFSDEGPAAGWICVVDFSSDAGTMRLSYFFSVQHLAFTNSLHREFGSPVDGGEFRGDPLLKIRRDQWWGQTRSNKSAANAGRRSRFIEKPLVVLCCSPRVAGL